MGIVRLSFDDGPLDDNKKSPSLSALNSIKGTLHDQGITADFYVNGVEVDKSAQTREAVTALHKAGHRVENHAWDHKPLNQMTLDEVRSQINRTQEIIKQLTDRTPTRLRPPYGEGAFGKMDPDLVTAAAEAKVTITLWQVDTKDWAPTKGLATKMTKILDDIEKKKHRPMTDVLMHVLNETARDLEALIARIKAAGHVIG